VVLTSGLAGTALLTPGTALASTTSQVATATSITATQEYYQYWGVATLKVSVSVTAQSGSQAPAGDVVVSNGSRTCDADLVAGSGLVSTGRWYRFTAGYRGADTFASSASAVDHVVVGAGPAFRADTPPLTATSGRDYGYTFQATGFPTPSFALVTGAPSWLSIDSRTGQLSGRVPDGISTFSYSVIASNGVGKVTAGAFTVSVSPSGRHEHVTTRLDCPHWVISGHSGTCTLTISNNGPRAAADLNAEIALPSQLRLRGCGWDRGCWVNRNTASWHLSTLFGWQTKSVSVWFTAGFGGPRWDARRPFHVTVTGIAQWGNGEWWQPSGVSYAFAHVTIYPHRWW
jgi:hypothetical protein